ncbi:uncharacterized protein HaLaN_24827, partial [Haematococcus lacustris]
QPRLTSYCRPGGLLLLSGILEEQVGEIRAAYAPHFENFEVLTDGAWAAVTAVRRAAVSTDDKVYNNVERASG